MTAIPSEAGTREETFLQELRDEEELPDREGHKNTVNTKEPI